MLPETHPLIEKVTEPLAANAERRMAANAFLGEKFDAANPGVAQVTARIEAAGRRKFTALRKVLPWVLAVAALVAAASPRISVIHMTGRMYDMFSFTSVPDRMPALPSGLTQEQRLLLGDPEVDELEQKRRLHLHAPENPAYFAEFAQAFVSRNERLPTDFLKTATRIAPDNAYFPWFAAGQIGRESLAKKKKASPSAPRMVDGVQLRPLAREMEFDITDSAAFEEALALVANAAAMPGFETYSNPMVAARVRLLPDKTLADFTRGLMYAYSGTSGMIQLRYVADLLCARAEQLSKSGRKEEFIALAAQRDAFIAHLGRNPDVTLIGELVHSVIASATAKNFEAGADRLGLTEMAETFRKQVDAFEAERDLRDIREKKGKNYPFPEDKASTLHRLTMPLVDRQVTSRPPLGDSDFEPMRRAEHELVGGFGLLALAVFLPLAALVVFLFRFAATPMIRVPAKRMAGVLGMADWLWVIGVGVVLPILFFLLVTRFTPLGGREYGVMFFQMAFPGVQHAALLLGLLITPAIIVRWRLAKRLEPFGFGDRLTVPLALAVMVMIAVWSLAALPFVEYLTVKKLLNPFTLASLAAPPALCLCLLFANALRAILGKPAARLAQCATAVAVLPAYPIAIILLCALAPIYSAGEKRWLAQETLLRIDPDAPDLGAYEFRIAAQKRKEINAITGVE